MPNYRRAFLFGGCWFYTVNLLDRRQSLLVDHSDALRSAFAATRKHYPFDIAAIVVLPEHLHAVWTLPPDEADFSTRWRLIKTPFAKALPDRERRSAVRMAWSPACRTGRTPRFTAMCGAACFRSIGPGKSK